MKDGTMVTQWEIIDAGLRVKAIWEKIRMSIGRHILLVKV